MDKELILPIQEAIIAVIATISGEAPVAGSSTIKSDNQTYGCLTAVIGLVGENAAGNLSVSFDEPCILFLVSKLFMEEITELNNDVLDASGEICNMMAGAVKNALSNFGYRFEMAQPTVFPGTALKLTQLSKAPSTSIPFSLSGNCFWVEANLETRQ